MPAPQSLSHVAGLLRDGSLVVPLRASFAFEDLVSASDRLVQGRVLGKIAVRGPAGMN